MSNIPKIDIDDIKENHEKKKDIDLKVEEIKDGIIKIEDEEVFQKNIKFIEGVIRRSYEYRNYINYLKEGLDLSKCSLMPGLDSDNLKIGLEMHHEPFTLYDLVDIVGRSKLETGQSFDAFEISEEVMGLHYRNQVGLIPLSSTAHDMAHSGAITITMDKVYGNFTEFYKKYRKFFSESQANKFAGFIGTTKEEVEHEREKLYKEIKQYNNIIEDDPF